MHGFVCAHACVSISHTCTCVYACDVVCARVHILYVCVLRVCIVCVCVCYVCVRTRYE